MLVRQHCWTYLWTLLEIAQKQKMVVALLLFVAWLVRLPVRLLVQVVEPILVPEVSA